jgi:hypothetical protein
MIVCVSGSVRPEGLRVGFGRAPHRRFGVVGLAGENALVVTFLFVVFVHVLLFLWFAGGRISSGRRKIDK